MSIVTMTDTGVRGIDILDSKHSEECYIDFTISIFMSTFLQVLKVR